MDGQATPAQIAALLTAMRVRGETPAELLGAVRAARARMTCISAPPGTIDVCGTGGDGQDTLNVSTAVAFVVAACGIPVAKHGNRALSSRTGGADVLAALGVDIPSDRAAELLARTGITFMFAPHYHAALRHAALPRAELGFRTLFNLVGPAANPACVRHQLVGVFAPRWLEPMAETLGALGGTRVWVVHGHGTPVYDHARGCGAAPCNHRRYCRRRRGNERHRLARVARWRERPVSRHRGAERCRGTGCGRA